MKTAMPTERMADYIRKIFPMLDYVPIAFITAKKGKNVLRLLQLAVQLHKQAGARASTGDLNRVIRHAREANTPPIRNNRQPKIFYATQISTHPPTIVLFTNGAELFDDTYIPLPDEGVARYVQVFGGGDQGGFAIKGEAHSRPNEESELTTVETVAGDDEAPPIVRAPKKRKKIELLEVDSRTNPSASCPRQSREPKRNRLPIHGISENPIRMSEIAELARHSPP